MAAFLQDVRYAIRTLRRSAGLTFVIVASLAIGIGANTAIFSVVSALLLKPLPYPEPDRLAALWLRSPGINIPQDWPSPGQYIDIQAENRSFDEMSISRGRQICRSVRPWLPPLLWNEEMRAPFTWAVAFSPNWRPDG